MHEYGVTEYWRFSLFCKIYFAVSKRLRIFAKKYKMKTISELSLGFSDASNYLKRQNKQLFADVFVKNDFLKSLQNPNVYYLIGEKGTGKTAYAVYLNNNCFEGQKSILKFIRSTDYEKFYELKKNGKIDISGFEDVWKTILLLLLAKSITKDDLRQKILTGNQYLSALQKAIDDYYNNAFSPEITYAFKIVDNSDVMAKLMTEHSEFSISSGENVEFVHQKMQLNLYYIFRKFEECFSKLHFSKNITLYIDGIDVRPPHIPYDMYLQIIRGLSDACWSLNNDVFSNLRDSVGQPRIVLLLRPDIFASLNLQNATNKLADNSVYLDWTTTYTDYKNSPLYNVAKKLIGRDVSNGEDVDYWEKYFDWKFPTTSENREYDTAFMEFLRISLSRPRDVQRIVSILQGLMKRNKKGNRTTFDVKEYKSDAFQNQYSEYFLGSLKDQLSFYYSADEFEHFKKFFELFEDAQFTYEQYCSVYKKYIDYICDNATDVPEFVEDPLKFLQLLYDSNVITAIEEKQEPFFHFSYREKSPTNIAPKVPIGRNVYYRFHYGLFKKTNKGRFINPNK